MAYPPVVGAKLTWLDATGRVRLGIALVGLLMAAILGRWVAALPWTLLVLGLDVLATLIVLGSTTRAARGEALGILVVAASLSGVAFGLTGMGSFFLLPLIAYHCALLIGRRAIIWVAGVAAVAETLVVLLQWGAAAMGHNDELSWLLTGIIFVLLGAWSLTLSEANEELDRARAREAATLLRRLEEVTGSLATGLDAPALGETVLRELRAGVTCDRCSLLAVDDGWPVPIALTGATRFPWRDPSRADSALHQAYVSARSDTPRYTDGRRTYELVCVPLLGRDGDPVGLLVADRQGTAFDDRDRKLVEELGDKWGPLLEASLLFARLRRGAALEERNRLAREMHDGVAQELAALAYRADAVSLLVSRGDAEARNAAGGLRDDIRGVVKGVRSHISDLRMLERPDRSLGAILGLALQDLAATTDLRTELALQESGMRFPADVELQLHQLVERVLAEARVARDATRVSLDVTLEAPNALILVEHDGTSRVTDDSFAELPVPRGMEVHVSNHDGLAVTIRSAARNDAPHTTDQKGGAHDLGRARR